MPSPLLLTLLIASSAVDAGSELRAVARSYPGDAHGQALAADAEWTLVGAPGQDVPHPVTGELGADTGAVRVFARNGESTWRDGEPWLASDGKAADRFGEALALEGERALVGAPGAAAVYEFTLLEGVWFETQRIDAPSEDAFEFGARVVMSDGLATIAARDAIDHRTEITSSDRRAVLDQAI